MQYHAVLLLACGSQVIAGWTGWSEPVFKTLAIMASNRYVSSVAIYQTKPCSWILTKCCSWLCCSACAVNVQRFLGSKPIVARSAGSQWSGCWRSRSITAPSSNSNRNHRAFARECSWTGHDTINNFFEALHCLGSHFRCVYSFKLQLERGILCRIF